VKEKDGEKENKRNKEKTEESGTLENLEEGICEGKTLSGKKIIIYCD